MNIDADIAARHASLTVFRRAIPPIGVSYRACLVEQALGSA